MASPDPTGPTLAEMVERLRTCADVAPLPVVTAALAEIDRRLSALEGQPVHAIGPWHQAPGKPPLWARSPMADRAESAAIVNRVKGGWKWFAWRPDGGSAGEGIVSSPCTCPLCDPLEVKAARALLAFFEALFRMADRG